MRPIKTENTNLILKAPSGKEKEVEDLPVTKLTFDNGSKAIESCWKLSPKELEQINKTGVIYFACMGENHPPILLSTNSLLK